MKDGAKALWAPWRMDYILAPRDGSCFLCDAFVAEADREHLVLLRGAACAVVMNRYPYNNGHLMIAPVRHVAEPADLTADERRETMDLVERCVALLRGTISPDGFNIGINLGKVAGAGLASHLHTHVVPRWNGDTNFMPVLGGTKVIPQALDELWARLRAAL